PHRGKILPPHHMPHTIPGVPSKSATGKRDIRTARRPAQPGDPVQPLARCQTPDAKAVVPELGNKQPLPLQIDSKVIDAAANLPEGYLRLKYQRWVCCLRSCRGGPDEARGQ